MAFNVRITVQGEFDDVVQLDLEEEELKNRIVTPYLEGKAFALNGVTIVPSKVKQIKIGHTKEDSSYWISIIEEEQRASTVIAPISREWYVTKKGSDVTNKYITGPAGSQKREPKPKIVTALFDKDAKNIKKKEIDKRSLYEIMKAHPLSSIAAIAAIFISLTATLYEKVLIPVREAKNYDMEQVTSIGPIDKPVNKSIFAIYRITDSIGRIDDIKLELETGKYDLLTTGYVSYELAQLVASLAYQNGESVSESTFSVDDIINALEQATKPPANKFFCANMIEISGNLVTISKEQKSTSLRDTIVLLIEQLLAGQVGHDDNFVNELARLKLGVLRGGKRKDISSLMESIQAGRRKSFYQEGTFENPDFWLPYLIGQPSIGDARFYAAYLLRKVPLQNGHNLIPIVQFLIKQERIKGANADQDVIYQLEQAGLVLNQ